MAEKNKENTVEAGGNGNCENISQKNEARTVQPMLGIGCGLAQVESSFDQDENQSKGKATPTVEINLLSLKQTDTFPVYGGSSLTSLIGLGLNDQE